MQIPLMREVGHVLRRTYFSKDFVSKWFSKQIKHEGLAGKAPCVFWQTSNLLNIQQHWHSQTEILEPFGEALNTQCGIAVKDRGAANGVFIYLDDVLSSGSRLAQI
ncbi:MAG: hypothetical protein IPK39_24605 [Sulfuritalea sp.]|nr:hypothetical protein [Sulfuritalea sp.]